MLKKENTFAWAMSMIDNDNYLYASVQSKEDYPKVVKYKLIFD